MIVGHVYVVGISDNPVKIGSARDVKARLHALQIGNADTLTLFHKEPTIHSLQKAESAVHRELKEFRRRGEWFDVSAEFAIATVQRIVPALVAEWGYHRRNGGGMLERVSAETALQPDAEAALKWYALASGAVDPFQRRLAAYAADAIQRRAGAKGWTVFKMFVIDGKGEEVEFGRDLRTARRVRLALGDAINHLANWYRDDLYEVTWRLRAGRKRAA